MLTIWRTWFVSDALGIITIAPLLIGVFSAVRDRPPPREALEGLLAIVCVTASRPYPASSERGLGSRGHHRAVLPALFVDRRALPTRVRRGSRLDHAITVVWSTTYGTGVFGNPACPCASGC